MASGPGTVPSRTVADTLPREDASGERPQRAVGVELLGKMTGSGYRTPPSLVRRPGGQRSS